MKKKIKVKAKDILEVVRCISKFFCLLYIWGAAIIVFAQNDSPSCVLILAALGLIWASTELISI